MLGYLFWHWPQPGIDKAEYAASLLRFHASLAATPPAGYRQSFTCQISPFPWSHDQPVGYEDWYLVDDFAALDSLIAAAVSGARKAPHDRAARAAEGGAGGIYRRQYDDLPPAAATITYWLSKPAGVSYDDFYASLTGWLAGAPVSLWQRQLVLGPAPEFCLLSRQELPLPATAGALRSDRIMLTATP